MAPLEVASALCERVASILHSRIDAIMGHTSMAQRLLTSFALLTTGVSSVSAAYNTSSAVTLPGYGTFVGTTVSQTLTKKPLPRAVDAWLGIDYASQPIGEARFAPVGAPEPFDGIKNASSYGYSCLQDPDELPYELDEACLSMNVFRPQGVAEDAELPVLIWIHGGGFVAGSARSFDGASFVANSREPLVVVTFNYRVSITILFSRVRLMLSRSTLWASSRPQSLSAKDFLTSDSAIRRPCSSLFRNTSLLLEAMLLASLLEVAQLVRTRSAFISFTTTTKPRVHRRSSRRLFSSPAV